MDFSDFLIVFGALSGGFVSGLTGFGTGVTALAFWLHVIPPIAAAPLVVICSIVSQLQTLPAIWHAIEWRRVLPFISGGLLGVPIGSILLPLISVPVFKAATGLFLLIYCCVMWFGSNETKPIKGGKVSDGLVGLSGGILGGLAGLSGPLPTIWARFRGWHKDQQRGVFQAFNLTILSFAAVTQWIGGLMTTDVGRLALIALPGTVLGAWLGRRTYARMGTASFNRAVLIVLSLSGLALVVSA